MDQERSNAGAILNNPGLFPAGTCFKLCGRNDKWVVETDRQGARALSTKEACPETVLSSLGDADVEERVRRNIQSLTSPVLDYAWAAYRATFVSAATDDERRENKNLVGRGMVMGGNIVATAAGTVSTISSAVAVGKMNNLLTQVRACQASFN